MAALWKKYVDDEFGNVVLDWAVLATGAAMLLSALVLTIASPARDVATDTPADMLETAQKPA